MTSHALYSWHHSLYIWHYIHCICVIKARVSIIPHPLSVWHHTHYIMTSHSVCMISHEHFMTSHTYRYDIISSIFMTSYLIYMLSPKLLSWKHNDYTCDLTHYIWYHSHCICVVTPALWVPSQLWNSSDFAHVKHHTHTTSHHIHTLWHQCSVFITSQHCIHDIRSPLYDITSTL